MAVKETITLTGTVATNTDQNVGGEPNPYVQGDDLVLEVTVEDDQGNAQDISAATGISWVLEDSDGNDQVTKTKSGGGITFTTDGTDGKFDVAVDSGDTSGLNAETYVHEATITDDGSGNQTTVLRGDFTISAARV